MLGLNANSKENAEKVRTLARGKYLTAAFLLSSDMRRYGELILDLKIVTPNSNGIIPKRSTTCTF